MTSTLNLQTSSTINAQKAVKASQNLASDSNGAASPGEFSNLFASLMGGNPGQQIADPEGKASPPANLAAEALGPAVRIITTTAPLTSDDSLLAFARAQGLDDSALALIFANAPATGKPMAPDAALSSMLKGAGNPAFQNLALSAPPATLDTTTPLSDLADLAALTPEATISWSLGKAGLVDGQRTGEDLKPVLFGLNGVRSALSMAPNAPGQINPADNGDALAEPQNLAATLMLGAAEAAQWSKRLQSRAAAGLRAEHLSQSFATLTSKASLTEASTETSAPIDTLMIGQEISGEDLPAIWAQRLGADGQSGQGSADASGEAAHAEQALRSEQYEKLSQRLGEALGQRLAAQIARGEWKVELALNPHKLGKIDVQLDMRQGELEASFKTSNPMTRELLIDGMPRLKEVLAQSGMEVAAMNVNARQDRQNGGNPTPGRQQQPDAPVSSVHGKATSNTVSGPAATSKQTGSQEGLDVRV